MHPRWIPSRKCALMISIAVSTFFCAPAGSTLALRRTVIRSEIGLVFAYPPTSVSWKDVGAYVGVTGSGYFDQMSERALRIEQGRFQHFEPADDNEFAFFPYSRLKQYEAQEVAKGRPALFITATYQGKKRPVYFSWSLGLKGDVPTTGREMWMQAVDVSSDRFINFWVNEYVKRVLWRGKIVSSAWWVGIDNCAFVWDLYGVIDDHGRFVSGVAWDRPFPQNSDEYLASIKQFFYKLHRIAPEIKTMCNIGSLKDPGQFQSLYADVPGIMAENISEPNPVEYARKGQYDEFTSVSWFTSLGRVAVLRAIVPRPGTLEQIRTATAIYLLIKGPNCFFAPELEGSTFVIEPHRYAHMESVLGEPTAVMQIERKASNKGPYYLYSRSFEHGMVFVNWSGRPQTVKLAADRQWFEPDGNAVDAINIPDLSGTYVTTEHPASQRYKS